MNYILKIIKNKHFLFVFIVCLTCCGMLSCNKQDDTKDDVYLKKFTDEELKTWKKENKESENKYTLNGGYYIHFNGINYPVVFESGKIISFDNAPDDLYFIEILAFYTDAKLKKRCAILAKFGDENISSIIFSNSKTHKGYVLDGKRPKNGTVLYIDETKEKKFRINDMEELIGPDETINNLGNLAYIELYNQGRIVISDSNGNLLDECSTIRKLYYFIKEQTKEIINEFEKHTEYTYIPYPGCFKESKGLYYYSNYLFLYYQTTFEEDEWENYCEGFYDEINIDFGKQLDYIDFDIVYNKTLPQEHYKVIVNSNGINSLEEKAIEYTNITRNDIGQIESYMYDGKTYNCFYGTIKEFDDFLKQNDYIDEENKQCISYFELEDGEKYLNLYFDYDNKIYTYLTSNYNTLYAKWDYLKTVTLCCDEDLEIYVCPNKEYILPEGKKAGYKFVGWYTSSDFKGEMIESISYDDNYSKLFAKFEKVDFYTLTFEQYENYTFDDIKYSYGDEVTLPTLTKPFYVFAGWCIDSKCQTDPMRSISQEFFGSYHLYPCFKPLEYTITLILDDSVENVKIKYGEEYVLPIENVKDNFIGYFDSNGVQYTDEKGKSLLTFTDGADIQLFAKYKTEETNE